MSWSEAVTPVRMQRVAVVAPYERLREALVCVADAGCVELDRIDDPGRLPAGRAAARLGRLHPGPAAAALSPAAPDLDAWEREGRLDLLAGEAQLEELEAGAVRRGPVAALAGWCPAAEVARLTGRLAAAGAAVLPLRTPRGTTPPTLLRSTGAARRSLTPLVTTYGTAAYRDLDPTWPTGIAFLLMFGVMFGDAGHGALLLVAALLLRRARTGRWARLRPGWPLLAGAGAASVLAGLAYGEFFGPTGVLPVLWLNPLEQPVRLLAGAVALGGLLLALAYAVGVVNRWREGGPARALCAVSGVAGGLLFLGPAMAAGGLYLHRPALLAAGAATAVAGLVTAGAGLFAESAGGLGGVLQAGIGLFGAVVRIGVNVASFARLAAFGLTGAALGQAVWRGTAALAGLGGAGWLGAALLLVTGTALVVALEGLVAGVQALRLEFYELFSRVFEAEGRPFRPWRVPVLEVAR